MRLSSTRPVRILFPLATAVGVALLPGPALSEVEPLPRSVEVRTPGAYVRTSPSLRGSRRGTLALRARLEPQERTWAEGCSGPWYRIAAEAWVCGEDLGVSSREPEARQMPDVAEGEVVPGRYGFAGPDGARLYRTLEQAAEEDWEIEYDPRSGLHMTDLVEHEGRHFYRLAAGGYVPADEVAPARPSRFVGVALDEGEQVGFVGRRQARVVARAGGGRVVRRLGPRSAVPLLETSAVARALWVRIAEAEWVRDRDLLLPRPPEPPAGLRPGDRWVDVDTTRQILTAYEGPRPVFTTLVSSGRRGAATPRGTYRIWAKLATAEMSGEGEEEEEEAEPYLMQGVPWVMYFNEGIALHGAYWHDGFGRVRSHGCVNLSPRDAAWLFEWTGPRLPPGWQGVLPTRTEPGTLVVVR